MTGDFPDSVDTFERGPMCPNYVNWDINPAHSLVERMRRVIFTDADRDEDGELSDEMDAAESRLSEMSVMTLWSVSANTVSSGAPRSESWYFQCPTCSLVLPASAPAIPS